MQETQGVPMGLTMILFTMIAAWVVAAMAMLWGVLRIARRHYPIAQADIDRSRPSKTSHLSAAS